MNCSLGAVDLTKYINLLLENALPDGISLKCSVKMVKHALERQDFCHGHIRKKYYRLRDKSETPVFDHMNGDHMAAFLWFLGNSAAMVFENIDLAVKLSYLNRLMHGLDLFYSVEMPDVFLLVHPVGTVIGRAQFNNYLVVYQNCTIGATKHGYPSFGEGVVLCSGASVLGGSVIGDNVIVGANTLILNQGVDSNCSVVNGGLETRELSLAKAVKNEYFGEI